MIFIYFQDDSSFLGKNPNCYSGFNDSLLIRPGNQAADSSSKMTRQTADSRPAVLGTIILKEGSVRTRGSFEKFPATTVQITGPRNEVMIGLECFYYNIFMFLCFTMVM